MAVLVAFLIVAGYLVLFYRQPIDGQTTDPETRQLIKRYEYQMALLTQPNYLLASWTGGDTSQVAFVDRWSIILAAATVLAFSYIVGRILLESLCADQGLTRLEVFVFSLGVGLNSLSLLTLAIGLLGGLRQPLYFGLPAIMVIGLAVVRWRRKGQGWTRIISHGDRKSTQMTVDRLLAGGRALWLTVPFVSVIWLGAMLPPRDFDVREYHLQVPKEWYQQGRIGFLEHNVYGNMPLGAEMHALLGMVLMSGERDWWWGALAGKTVIAMFAPLTMLALFAAGRRFVSRWAGILAALIYISAPWIAHVSLAGLIEGALAFYLFTAFYVFLIWSRADRSENPENEEAQRGSRGHLLLSGFLAGSAVACKYPALLFVAVPLTAAVLISRRKWKPAAVFLLALVCGCGPWFAKNHVLTGNPTYPLLYEVFGGRTRTPQKDAQWKDAHAVPQDEQGRRYSVGQLSRAAWQATVTSQWLSPLLIPLAALSLVARRHRGLVLVLMLYYVYVLACWWLFTHRIDRFWIPVSPVVALLAGVGANWSQSRLWRHVLVALLAWGLVGNWLLIASPAIGDVRFFVALEQLREDLPKQNDPTPSRMNPAHRYLNEHVPDGYQVLLVGDARPFDLEVPVLYNTCFDSCIFESLLKGKTQQQRLTNLRQQKISHVFIHWGELQRYRSPGNYGYAAGSDFIQPSLLDELVAGGVLKQPIELAGLPSPDRKYPRPRIYPVVWPAETQANGDFHR